MDDVEKMGFMRQKDFIGETGMSDSTWSNRIRNGQLPPKYDLSIGTVGYLKSDIHIFLKFMKLYKWPRRGQLWFDIKKRMLERHSD